MERDAHGQPINRAFRAKHNIERSIDEMLGICKGITADSNVSQDEALFLYNWIRANAHVKAEWPVNIILARLQDFLADGVLDKDEKRELFDLLKNTVGGQAAYEEACNLSAMLPLDTPPPAIRFNERVFCLTGRFAYGSRRECSEEIINLGGWVHPHITQNVDYLVIGTMCSRDWIHTNYGRKIERAIEYRAQGLGIAIVSEDNWASQLIFE